MPVPACADHSISPLSAAKAANSPFPYPAPKHTDLTARFENAEDVRTRFFFRRAYTGCYSLAALPAISVPGGFTADGLPIGLQLGARPFAEGTLFRAAYAYEQASDWHKQHPEL